MRLTVEAAPQDHEKPLAQDNDQGAIRQRPHGFGCTCQKLGRISQARPEARILSNVTDGGCPWITRRKIDKRRSHYVPRVVWVGCRNGFDQGRLKARPNAQFSLAPGSPTPPWKPYKAVITLAFRSRNVLTTKTAYVFDFLRFGPGFAIRCVTSPPTRRLEVVLS